MADEKDSQDKYQDGGGTRFPDPRIDMHLRDKEFHKRCIDFALKLHFQRRPHIDKITALKNSYNGISQKGKFDFIDKMYGTMNKARYVDYRLSRRVISRILGEWLERPLNATVYTVNSSARLKKMQNEDVKLGMRNPLVKKNVEKLRQLQVADPFDGMTFDENQVAPTVWQQMTDKSKNEVIMQIFLNDDIKKKGLKDRLYFNLQDILLGAECFGKCYIRKDGREEYRPIDNRRRISLESENDPFGKRSPWKGEERPMYVHEIIQEFPKLTNEDIKTIHGWEGQKSESFVNNTANNYFTWVDNTLMVNTFTIEFPMFLPFVRKINNDGTKADISNEYLMDGENRKKLRQGETKGEYKIEVKWKKILHQVTKIGPDVYTEWGPAPGIIGSIEKPFETMTNYVELLFDTVGGLRVSLMQLLEELKQQYNVVRLMINREIIKFKGVQFKYDRALLPKVSSTGQPVTMEQVIYQMVNDGWSDYNSAADGNMGGESKDPKDALTVQDIGLSASVKTLLEIAFDLERLTDRIAGFNSERTGETPASSTATNATNNLISSRSMTAPIFYFFDRYCEEVMLRVIELKKICYGVLHKEEGELLIGNEAMGFLQATKDLANDDYGVFLSDGRREEMIRQRMGVRMDQAVNAGEMRISDAYSAEMAETLSEAQAILEKGWKEIQEANKQANQIKTQQIEMQLSAKAKMEKDKIENIQKGDADLEVLKSDLKKGEMSREALNDYILNEQDYDRQQQMLESETQ